MIQDNNSFNWTSNGDDPISSLEILVKNSSFNQENPTNTKDATMSTIRAGHTLPTQENRLPYSLHSEIRVNPNKSRRGIDKKSRGPWTKKNTSSVAQDDFEYFSLSPPPAGATHPVQIFPKINEPIKPKDRGGCREFMVRIPYATVIATIMCCVGVGTFCFTTYRGFVLTQLMFQDVFKMNPTWIEPLQLTFIIVAAVMGGLSLMLLLLGCLSTGSTRNKVYQTYRGRIGGRISCAIFMAIMYIFAIIWLVVLCCVVIATLFYTLAWFQCRYVPDGDCIDYNQFGFLFPDSTTEEDKRVCREEKKVFCKDVVNTAEIYYIISTVTAFLVVMSLIHYLMCLASNYAHIKDHEKFVDLTELQYLQESEMTTLPKERF